MASTPSPSSGSALDSAERPDASPAFPFRVAAVDVGSNAIRYAVAEFTRRDRFQLIHAERIAVRLGRDVFTRDRTLTPASIEAGTEALRQARRRLDDLGVAHYRAVATSAVRESRNGAAFIEAVRRDTGIHLETISGSEEARLVWLAVRHRMALGEDRWILADLGGGSVEVSVVDREGILWSESHTLGTVRLLQGFQENGMEATDDLGELLSRYAHVLKLPRAVAEWAPRGMIATGGNIEALAGLARAPRGEDGVAVLEVEALREMLGRLVPLDEAARMERFGLRADRADVIVPAAVVYERVAELAEADRIHVPGVGVREGVLLDLVDDLVDRGAHRDRQDMELQAGAIALGRRCRFDEAHALKVTELALALHDQLASLHGLVERPDGSPRRVLKAAALLHDVGQFISYRRHHKHSWYMVSNADLPGLSPRELQMAALVARYHRRAEPDPAHPGYDLLDPEGREVVRRLAALLRVADALDREHVGRVTGLEARIEEDAVVLHLETRGAPTLEAWALRKKGKMFRTVFEREIRMG